ncbi:MAG: cobalt ECF transporter T component CbiQ [Ardenticatenaceae bacterium]
MPIIDRYVYASRLRTVDPAYKAGLAVLVLLLCLLLNKPAVGLLAVGWMWGIACGLGGLSVGVFGRILLAEGLFLLLTTVGIAISVTLSPPNGTEWALQVGPLWLSSSPEALQTVWYLITRTLGGTAALNFLALTTPMVDLVELLRRLRVPALLIDIMTLMYRFLFTLLDSLNRMYTAQDSRLGYSNFRRGMTSAGLLGSRLFINAYQRSQRLQIALDSRCAEGELRVLPTTYVHDRRLIGVSIAVVLTLIIAGSI